MNRKDRRATQKQNRAGAPRPAAAGATSSAALAAQMLMAAHRHHQAGELAPAEDLYRRVLGIDPQHAMALHFLGVLLHQKGQSEAALELIRRAIAHQDGVPEFHFNIA